MSGLGRAIADLELRNSRAMSAAQARWDNMAPPEPDDERTSLQPLGNAQVLVEYVAPFGIVSICGAYLNAEFVDEYEFSRRRLEAWRVAVQAELDREIADAAECARLQDELDREAA